MTRTEVTDTVVLNFPSKLNVKPSKVYKLQFQKLLTIVLDR